jgi:hypothetical protein
VDGHDVAGVINPVDVALGGALAEIAGRGGGTVEGYPEETADRMLSGSFLQHRSDGRLREPRLRTHAADFPASLGGHPHRRPGLTCAIESARARPLDRSYVSENA